MLPIRVAPEPMIGSLQLDIGSRFYKSHHILSCELEYFLTLDVSADEDHMLSPREATTAGGPLFCGSKTSALPPRRM